MTHRINKYRRANEGDIMRYNPSIFMRFFCIVFVLTCCVQSIAANRAVIGKSKADQQLAEYFRAQTKQLSERCLRDIKTLEDWENKRLIYRKQLFEMLSLDPLPKKTDLKPVITGTIEHDEFTVENIHFQSMPGLYVTANLYIPKDIEKPVPAILYVCGHGPTKKNNISYGTKVSYQRHAAWFARHGYVCLIIDTLQMGEIEGIHHGTYRYDMWWWNSRGYTSAGAEAWNCIRSLDYLQSRKEVDKDRIGVTGRSGGGAYSWWIAALDERIKAAVPVAGITDLQNHVVDGSVEGHCDCMFIVNTYRWDYPLVAALVAPRPLLISNSDKDTIFPLDGVVRLHEKVRDIYRLYGADDKLGLQITEGPHKDTQELRIHAFVWFNRFLKGENPLIDKPAVPFFEPEQLKVFDELPADEINTKIQESFVPTAAKPRVPKSAEQWEKMRKKWMRNLRMKSFRGWPRQIQAGPLDIKHVFSVEREGIQLTVYDFTSQPNVPLRLYLTSKTGLNNAEAVTLNVLGEQEWSKWLTGMRIGFENELSDQKLPEPDKNAFKDIQEMLENMNSAVAYISPRGIGPDVWNDDERKQVQIRRRFMLLGQTADGMRVWDVRRAIQALRTIESFKEVPVTLTGRDKEAGIALYASLFEPNIHRLFLSHLPETHRNGPIFLNVMRYLDIPQAVAMAAERSQVRLIQESSSGWQFPQAVAENLGWPDEKFQIRLVSKNNSEP
ncbi:MAG: alpha/beta hydrolase family protein [Sedimentisphaerales bacterium]|nr:alpha/beta hydrolase family protein [Sedimentisphaerales bacterium]